MPWSGNGSLQSSATMIGPALASSLDGGSGWTFSVSLFNDCMKEPVHPRACRSSRRNRAQ
eukprot:1744561-Pyramimonas_sp.AAC.1